MGKPSQHKNSKSKKKSNNLVTDKLIAEINALAKENKVSVEFVFNPFSLLGAGGAYPLGNKIYIQYHYAMPKRLLMTIFCHELAHCLNLRNGKFVPYHSIPEGAHGMTEEHIRAVIRTGLRAEIYTDEVGKKLMSKYFPRYKYLSVYKRPKIQEYYRREFLSFFREKLLTFQRT